MKKNIFLLLLAFVLFSCRDSKPPRASMDNSGMTEVVLSDDHLLYLQDGLSHIEVVPLESSGNVMVGAIDGLIMTDEHIIVYDRSQTSCVFIFGRNGKHRATINRRGRGPQEYTGLSHVALLPDLKTIAIHDNPGNKMLYFSLDGHFISTTPAGFWFSNMEYINENHLVCATYGAGEDDPGLAEYEHRTDLAHFTDSKFGIKSSALPMRYDHEKFQEIITPNIRKFGDQVYINRPYSDTIYRAMEDGLKAVYRIELGIIDGVANPDPGITGEELSLLQKEKNLFSGRFTDSEHFLSITVAKPMPPRNILKNYLYSKRSGKVYSLEVNTMNMDNLILWQLNSPPKTSLNNSFATIVPAYYILMAGSKNINARMQRPELAGLTEDSNPVVILYSFKEDL